MWALTLGTVWNSTQQMITEVLNWLWTYQIPSPAAEIVDRLSDAVVLFAAGDVVLLGSGEQDDRQQGEEHGEGTHFEFCYRAARIVLDTRGGRELSRVRVYTCMYISTQAILLLANGQ